MSLTYRKAGVNISVGEEVVQKIKGKVRSSFTRNVLTDIGSFGAFYRASFPGIKDPVLVSSVDGVGTKLMIASALKTYDTVGQDLVNHCVNDIAVCGATPLYFMDYFATGKLSVNTAKRIIGGFVKACRQNSCSLIGGETAEMPGIYRGGDFDLAGMIVGVVERRKIIDGRNIRAGDILLGLPSTGLHTNGYSLARKVFIPRFSLHEYRSELRTTIGKALLAVHRSYLTPIRVLLARQLVRGMSHVTGGGIVGNTMRVVPEGLRLAVDWRAWRRPPLFTLIQELGKVPEEDMRRTFNLGIGMVFIVSSSKAAETSRRLRSLGERPVVVGEVERVS
ncbi:MAG TPA: phosphoribosylformylglycinamidine cyclo-ligase [Bacteroidota bacterium]|nr:phosphoribosylformylglycinamidine cyclo-ligase [Bacteroidota bacterium]